VKAEKTDSTVISEETTEAVISVEAPEASHVTEEWTKAIETALERTPEDPVPDLENENPAIIGNDQGHVIVKKDKGRDQEKAGNQIFGGRDPPDRTGSRGDQDQLNVIETVGIEPPTVTRKAEMYHPTTQS